MIKGVGAGLKGCVCVCGGGGCHYCLMLLNCTVNATSGNWRGGGGLFICVGSFARLKRVRERGNGGMKGGSGGKRQTEGGTSQTG